jgi:predicted nucleic acid-binding protein
MAGTKILADTGPLVAYLSRSDQHHRWAATAFRSFCEPLHTCEAVISEVTFLLRSAGVSIEPFLQLLDRGAVKTAFRLDENQADVSSLLRKYSDQRMSLADAVPRAHVGVELRMPGVHNGQGFPGLSSQGTRCRSFARAILNPSHGAGSARQRRTVPSTLLEARMVPSGENSRLSTESPCPRKVSSSRMSQRGAGESSVRLRPKQASQFPPASINTTSFPLGTAISERAGEIRIRSKDRAVTIDVGVRPRSAL